MQACQKAGIDIEVKAVTASVYFSSDVGNPDTYTKFYTDIQMYTTTQPQPDPGVFMNQFTSDQVATKENKWQGRNITRWRNDEYDKLYRQAEGELDPPDPLPRLAEAVGCALEDLLDEPRLDEGHRALRDEELLVRPAEQPVDDRIDDERRDLEADLPLERRTADEVEAGGIGQPADELRVGHLGRARHADLDDRAEEPRERRAEVPREGLVQHLERAHLVLRDALGTLEVVGADLDLLAVAAGAGEDLRGRGLDGDLGLARGVEQRVDVGLVQHLAHGRPRCLFDPAPPGGGRSPAGTADIGGRPRSA